MTKYSTDGETFFDGKPSGEPLWNGFETPMFTQSEAFRILGWVNGGGVNFMAYDAVSNVFYCDHDYDMASREIFENVRFNDETFYLVGTSSWTWLGRD
jgi:hypothetical protein